MVFVLLNFCLFLKVIKAVKLFYNLHYCCDKICNDHFEIAHICSFLNVSSQFHKAFVCTFLLY